MAVGEITRDGFPYLALKGLTKTNVAISKGQVAVFDTDGWMLSTDALPGPHGVALNTQTATALTQKEMNVLIRGCVIVAKAAEDQFQGQSVKWNGSAVAKLTEGVDNLMSIVGTVLTTALTAVGTVEIILFQ